MRSLTFTLALAVSLLIGQPALSHCEIPCGIYDDQMRVNMLAEHITTIEKSMNRIVALSKDGGADNNQLIRWVMNKENHAEQFQNIVCQYFMTQRIKVPAVQDKTAHDGYLKKLSLLHRMLVHAMKTKQTTDLSHVMKLRALLSEFEAAYFGVPAETGEAVQRKQR